MWKKLSNPTLHTSWKEHFFLLSSVSKPKITAGPMCGLWYENNQFGHNEIKIKGKLEQKQIYYDRLSSSGNLKAVVVAAWNNIKLFLLKRRKQTLISSTMLTAWRQTENCDNLQASILSLLSFSGAASDWHNQTAERPSVLQTGM